MRHVKFGIIGLMLALAGAASARADTVTAVGSSLSDNSVPTPGSQGYVFYAWGAPDGSVSATPNGVTTGTFASPVSYVSINTNSDLFFTSSVQNGGYTLLDVNGTTKRTGVAYLASNQGQTDVLAVMTLLAGTPSSFRLGVLIDNAPGPQNNQASLTIAGFNSVTTPVLGNSGGAHNDFYYFDITNAHAGETLSVSVTNNGHDGSFAYTELGGFTFDSTPLPPVAETSLVLLGCFGLCHLLSGKKLLAIKSTLS